MVQSSQLVVNDEDVLIEENVEPYSNQVLWNVAINDRVSNKFALESMKEVEMLLE